MSLRVGLDSVEKWKTSCPVENRTPVPQPIVRCYTDWAVPAHVCKLKNDILI
jgi:hypothetical protein